MKIGNRDHVYAIFVMDTKRLLHQNISDIRRDLNDYTKLPREINRGSRKKIRKLLSFIDQDVHNIIRPCVNCNESPNMKA